MKNLNPMTQCVAIGIFYACGSLEAGPGAGQSGTILVASIILCDIIWNKM